MKPSRHSPLPWPAPALLALAACAADPPPRSEVELGIELPARFGLLAPGDAVRSGGSTPTEADRGPTPSDPATAWWQQFGDPDLDALVTAALDHNRDLQAALTRLAAAAAARTIAGAPLLPAVDASLDAARQRRVFLGFPFGGGGVPNTTVTTFGLSLGVRWELDVWGRLRAGDAAALGDQQAALADYEAAQLSLVGQVCRGWFAAVEARQQLALAEATVATFRATADDVRDRFRRGVRPALDVHVALTNLANAEAEVAARRDALQRAQRQLEVLAGRYPAAATATASTLPAALPEVPAVLPTDLLQRRPDLAAAERRLAAAGCRVEAARAALYPALTLDGSLGTNGLEPEDLADVDFRVWSLGAGLFAPLFRGGALRAEVARQEARAAEAVANYGASLLRACAEVEQLLASERQLVARREHLDAAARHATAARDLARERYQAGLADFLAVADGQRQAFTAAAARIAVDRASCDNRIDLLLALGGGYVPNSTGAAP
jgi:NodT family efflux transporter outer membrane factor (OMF) lipoprotein